MKHYKSGVLSNFRMSRPLHSRKAPTEDFLGTVLSKHSINLCSHSQL